MISVLIYDVDKDSKRFKDIVSGKSVSYESIEAVVKQIIADVRNRGDEALFEYSKRFDNHSLSAESIRVTRLEIETACAEINSDLMAVLEKAAKRISDFHMRERRNSWLETSVNGEILGQLIRPLERVGVYVPGGKAAYPSSVLMNVIPAKIAGVRSVAMATPAVNGRISPAVLAAAYVAGVDEIYKIGGAQAVAALAYGTQCIPKVDKITGPGNAYVACAKRIVFGQVGIDSVAGPSEILIIADETANPAFVAADMLSQAEHDELARSLLVTTSSELAENVRTELEKQTESLERKAIIETSLQDNGAIIVTNTIEEAVGISNAVAPEHLELCMKEPFSLLPLVQNAGAVFLGHYTPEPLGDYLAGANHVIPTSGSARFFSPLSVDDFIKRSSVLSFGKSAFDELAGDVIRFAEAEGLTAHANSIKVRGEGK